MARGTHAYELPPVPIDFPEIARARYVSGLGFGGAALLAVTTAIGWFLFRNLAVEYPSLLVFVWAFAVSSLGVLPLLGLGLGAQVVARRGGWRSMRKDMAAADLVRARLHRRPLAWEVLEERLKRERKGAGMRPETIHRFLEARGDVEAADLDERAEIRQLVVYTIGFAKQAKALVREQHLGDVGLVTMAGQTYPMTELDRVCFEVSKRVTDILRTETPVPPRERVDLSRTPMPARRTDRYGPPGR